MTTRYITDNEKAGVKRRQAVYRARLRALGQKPREIWATDLEAVRLRSILAVWRAEPNDLAAAEKTAAKTLKPVRNGPTSKDTEPIKTAR